MYPTVWINALRNRLPSYIKYDYIETPRLRLMQGVCYRRETPKKHYFPLDILVPDCPRLALSDHVIASPSRCVTSSSSIATKCSFRCPRGFKLQGPSYKRCGSNGKWTDPGATVRCIGETGTQLPFFKESICVRTLEWCTNRMYKGKFWSSFRRAGFELWLRWNLTKTLWSVNCTHLTFTLTYIRRIFRSVLKVCGKLIFRHDFLHEPPV